MRMERRRFLQSAAAAAAPPGAASDRVRVAVMGVRGRGRALIQALAAMPDVDVPVICEVDPSVTARAMGPLREAKRSEPKVVSDLRRVLDDRSVDAVVVAAPDHWHAPAAILACDAGKDVYVEKPASHNIREGRLMVEAARRNRRVVQVGTQGRNREHVRRAIAFVHSGAIGRVISAKAWNVQLRENIGRKQDQPVPPGVDYENWTGPAAMLPFNLNRFHYTWHWHWNYGTGDVGNDGAHQLDMARWALGVGAPAAAAGSGGKFFFDDDQQTPDTVNVSFLYPERKTLLFEMRIWAPYGLEGVDNGVAVYGSDGMVHIGRWDGAAGWRVFDAKGKRVRHDDDAGREGGGEGRGERHMRDFIDCVKSRGKPQADIETGHLSGIHCHLANIVARTGRAVKFDAARETIEGDAEAARLVGREYRAHWGAPRA